MKRLIPSESLQASPFMVSMASSIRRKVSWALEMMQQTWYWRSRHDTNIHPISLCDIVGSLCSSWECTASTRVCRSCWLQVKTAADRADFQMGYLECISVSTALSKCHGLSTFVHPRLEELLHECCSLVSATALVDIHKRSCSLIGLIVPKSIKVIL